MKNIAIIGSTGSIGTQTLDVIDRLSDVKVVALSCNNNVDLLEKQIRKYKPDIVSVSNENEGKKLKSCIKDTNTKVLTGENGLLEVSSYSKIDLLITAIVGMQGIRPTISAIKEGKNIALANKETLVCAGKIITDLAKKNNVEIFPIDSEHSAIFQSINFNKKEDIKNLILTASGGPFLGKKTEDLKNVTVKDALKHPTWKMGNKVTIDSATLSNKGLEIIEAKWLFDISPEKIKVIIHPQSIIHSMVEYNDGAVIAELSKPDMKIPISYAITYPKRAYNNCESFSFDLISKLQFEKPDYSTFKSLTYAYDAIKKGGNLPAIFNIANEVAVDRFLLGKIGFLDIYNIIEKELSSNKFIDNFDIDYLYDLKTEIENKY